MTQLKKYDLEFETSKLYLQKSLENTNQLSISFLNLTNLNSGFFYTLLPENVNPTKINNFGLGGIAKTVRSQVPFLILNNLTQKNTVTCIIDDFNNVYSPNDPDDINLECWRFHKNEIYYVINCKNASIQSIDQCLDASNTVWHSLCILSNIDLNSKLQKELSLHNLESICLNAELAMIGAYDGEGYIFWQKGKSNS